MVGADAVLPDLRSQGISAAVVAIGANRLRQDLGADLVRLGFDLPVIVHPTAPGLAVATFGAGVVVMAGAHIGARARIGELSVINTGPLSSMTTISARRAHVAPGVALAGCVRVGQRTLVGNRQHGPPWGSASGTTSWSARGRLSSAISRTVHGWPDPPPAPCADSRWRH
ncbi:MAG: hypothetical protein WDN45_17355 [Caulobacteraceae bacterium]